MALQGRRKTVAFFEIRDSQEEPFPDPLPWDKHLADISRESAAARKHRLGTVDHWGQIYTSRHGGTGQLQSAGDREEVDDGVEAQGRVIDGHDDGDAVDHFILARYREDVSTYNIATGDIVDTASDSAKPWVELSVVHFLPESNIIGFVLGSHASPRISSLQAWLNEHGLVQGGLTIVPVLSSKVTQKIQGASEATILRVSYRSDQLDVADPHGTLAGIKKRLNSEFHNVTVDLVFRIEGGTSVPERRDERVKLLDVAKEVSRDDFAKASAKLIKYKEEGGQDAETVDFLKHRLTRKERVVITDKEGKSVKIRSAIDAIYRAADRLADELHPDRDNSI